MSDSSDTKYIFVCGGVLSGVGKGIVTASLGVLLKNKGYSVTAVKIDPYFNFDAGLMRPAEHGEVFVTEDGGEIDQDLGNYERFLGEEFSKSNNITSGKIYHSILEGERSMKYAGRDVEFFPDVINEVEYQITQQAKGKDICLVEIGGTTGDVENLSFLHAAREMAREGNAVFIMVTYLPLLRTTGELKTKPTQHAVARLREVGISPDFIVTRNEIPIDKPRRNTISIRCFIDKENIIDNPDLECVYDIPLIFNESGFAEKVLKKLNLKDTKTGSMKPWEKFVAGLTNDKNKVKIALVGKYVKHGNAELKDSYISVIEAIRHAAGNQQLNPEITMLSAQQFEEDPNSLTQLSEFDGIIVPQGWGHRGSEGKILAIEYIREHKIPYLGLCYGMQMAIIEYARNKLALKDANSIEINPDTPDPVVHIMPDQKEYLAKKQYGGTIRLGGWDCKLKPGSLVYTTYKKFDGFKDEKNHLISERHRHRYEVNNEYLEQLEKAGLVVSGTSPDGKLVEFIELPQKIHPFFLATQGHPEYKSQPLKPNPTFMGFIEAAAKHRS